MADAILDLDKLPQVAAQPQTPPYDFRTDETLLPRSEYTALGLLAGRRMTNGDEIMLARAVIRLTEEAHALTTAAQERAAALAAEGTTLLVVEGVSERDTLQKLLDPTTQRVLVIAAMQRGSWHIGRRFKAIIIRYPSTAWFRAKKVETHEFQEWEREVLYPRLTKGGHFQHI